MKKVLLVILVLVVVAAVALSMWFIGGDGDEYYSEAYNKIYFSFNVTVDASNASSYVIIPAPIQNGTILQLSDFQSQDGIDNYSFEFLTTEHGEGIKISPIPDNDFRIWFGCERYTAQGPFDIVQTDQFYKSDYPGLSMWETDGGSGYYWFYCSENVTGISYKYEYSDCYAMSDKGGAESLPQGWSRIKYMRVQEEMPM
jgi:hypothetical protein